MNTTDSHPDPRFKRQILLPGWGEEGQRRLATAKVLVVGAGGLGAPILSYLAGVGLGVIGISEADAVNVPDLHRQFLFTHRDIGHDKGTVATQFIGARHRGTTIQEPPMMPFNVKDTVIKYDIVLDATDGFSTKYMLADACAVTGTTFVWGSIVGAMYQVSVFDTHPGSWLSDFGAACQLRDVYPTVPEPGTTPDPHRVGTLGPAAGVAGATMAGEVCKLLVHTGQPLFNRVLMGNLWEHRADVVPYHPRGA